MTYNRFKPATFLMVAEKRWVTIVSAIVACLVFSGFYVVWKTLTPVYASSYSIKIEQAGASDGFINRLLSAPSDNIETQQAIIMSHDFLKGVAAKLSLIDSNNPAADQMVIEDLRSRISLEREDKTGVLHITTNAKEPVQALKLNETLVGSFITSYKEEHNKRLDEVIAHINNEQKATGDKLKAREEELERFIKENRLVSIDLEGEALISKKNEIEDKAGKSDTSLGKELKKVNENIDLHMDKKIEFDRMKTEVDSLRNIASFLEEKRQEAMIRKAENPDDVRVISPAQQSLQPVNAPDYLKIMLTGLIAGIILGLIIITFQEVYDHSSGLIEKLENVLKLRIIGIIPQVTPKDFSDDVNSALAGLSPEQHVSLITHFTPRTLASESFRGLRANIQAAVNEGKIKTIAVTGSYPHEGSTTVLLNLSICLAQAGMKTLLVGADLNSPDISERFSIDEGAGLTDILLGASPWEETVKTVTDIIIGGMTLDLAMLTPGLDKLNIITRGTLPNKPGELLGTKRFSEFIGAIRDAYDIIIIDSPAVLSSADAAALAAQVDGLIVVYNPAQVSDRALKRTCAQLGRMSCNIMGIVLNYVRPALIPDVLRDKYSGAETTRKAAQPPYKKGGMAKVLIPVAAIIIVIALIWWQRDWIFKENQETKVKEIVKPIETPAEIKPQKPDMHEQKPGEAELPETKAPVETPVEKSVTPEAIEQKIPDVASEPAAETKTEIMYQEGRYPYSVYLGSFDSTDQARSALDKYLKADIESFWVKVNLGEKGIWYRVYSGEFPDKEGAEAFINEKAIKDGEIKKTTYAVYIGSFTDRESLEGMVNILKENDYSPYIIADENFDSLLAGAFVTKTGADELSAELTALGISNRVVLR